MIALSVNVDHVATLRQARGTTYPDPLDAALLAEAAGASGITIHLRCDRRHIQDSDLSHIQAGIQGKLNLEMSTADEMLEIAIAHRPHQVTLVPERPEELTTEGGLDLHSQGENVAQAARRLLDAGIDVSVFLDPDPSQVDRLMDLGTPGITGFEINTDAYTKAWGGDWAAELEAIRATAERGQERGLHVYAGHGLTTENVVPVARLGLIEEMNIGHWLIARASLVGIERAVKEMLVALES